MVTAILFKVHFVLKSLDDFILHLVCRRGGSSGVDHEAVWLNVIHVVWSTTKFRSRLLRRLLSMPSHLATAVCFQKLSPSIPTAAAVVASSRGYYSFHRRTKREKERLLLLLWWDLKRSSALPSMPPRSYDGAQWGMAGENELSKI